MIRESIIQKLFDLIKPIVEEKDLEFYYLEYVKEAGENYLRVYIDKPEGISLEDCEKVSRSVSDMLDIEDPIPESYYLEVSSAGMERTLYTEEHLKRYIGNSVIIKLSKLFGGKKKYEGSLVSYNESEITINIDNSDFSIPRENISAINLKGEF
jgi:ribosome maturation factor RimP